MRRFDREWQLLESAHEWLVDRGYVLVDSRGPEGMDQGFRVYSDANMAIRFIADRSQWFVDIQPGPSGADRGISERWFDLEDWGRCLGSPVIFHDERRVWTDEDRVAVIANSWWLEPQLAYLRDQLGEIEQACLPAKFADTLSCLAAQGHGRS